MRKGTSVPYYRKLKAVSFGECPKGLNDTSSRNPAQAGERTAVRFCCNRQNPKAQGCEARLRSRNTAGHNNSNLAPQTASAASGEWELILGIVPITVLYRPEIASQQESLPYSILNLSLMNIFGIHSHSYHGLLRTDRFYRRPQRKR